MHVSMQRCRSFNFVQNAVLFNFLRQKVEEGGFTHEKKKDCCCFFFCHDHKSFEKHDTAPTDDCDEDYDAAADGVHDDDADGVHDGVVAPDAVVANGDDDVIIMVIYCREELTPMLQRSYHPNLIH